MKKALLLVLTLLGRHVDAEMEIKSSPPVKVVPLKRLHRVQWVDSVNMSSWYKDWELCLLKKNASYIVTNFKEDVLSCARESKHLTHSTSKKKRVSRVGFRCHVGNTYYCKFPNCVYIYVYVRK